MHHVVEQKQNQLGRLVVVWQLGVSADVDYMVEDPLVRAPSKV
jgi:hypothetical protein